MAIDDDRCFWKQEMCSIRNIELHKINNIMLN